MARPVAQRWGSGRAVRITMTQGVSPWLPSADYAEALVEGILLLNRDGLREAACGDGEGRRVVSTGHPPDRGRAREMPEAPQPMPT